MPDGFIFVVKDPPATIVFLAKIILIECPVVEANFPKSHSNENPGHSFIRKPFEPVWSCESNGQTYECSDCEN